MRHRSIHIAIIIACLGILLIASFFDLNISNTLYNPSSFFGQFFRDFGELPAFLLMNISLTIIIYQSEKNAKKLVLRIVLKSLLLIICAVLISKFVLTNNEILKVIISFSLSAALIVLSYKLLTLVDEKTLQELAKIALIIIIVILASNITVQVLKYVFGRVRFRSIDDNYTPWYIVNGINGNQSFPSGHVSAASNSLCLILIYDLFKIKKKPQIIIITISILLILLTGLSRIIMGAHYLSDVVVGALIGYIAVLIASRKIYEKQPKLSK